MENKYLTLWEKVLEELEKQFDYSTYEENFQPIKHFYKYTKGNIYMMVPNNFIKNKIESFYINKIQTITETLTVEKVRFKFITDKEIQKNEQVNNAKTLSSPEPGLEDKYRIGNLNATYNFNNFIVGKSNRMAYLASTKVASQPGVVSNPLFLFGNSGLGKTHLSHAIGNEILDTNYNKKIMYIKTQDFIDDYSTASRKKTYDNFYLKYSDIDVLLVDDIQFLSGKQKTQLEFFKLFEKLYETNKQIVLTSDRPPNELQNIMDRLITRFSMGINLDITTPDLEHRIEILKSKLEREVPDPTLIKPEILEYLAKSFSSNIRELEGGLRRILFFMTIITEDMDLERAKEALKPIIKSNKESPKKGQYNIKNVLETVSTYYNISVKDLESKSRKSEIAYPRHISCYILREEYKIPYKEIGKFLGGRDHTTIMNSYQRILNDIKIDNDKKNDIKKILEKMEKN